MLAQAETPVVFALDKPISLGAGNGDGGEMEVKGQSILKVPQRRA